MTSWGRIEKIVIKAFEKLISKINLIRKSREHSKIYILLVPEFIEHIVFIHVANYWCKQ